MRTITALLLAVAIGMTGACVRDKDKPKTEPARPQPAHVKPAPIAEHDLTGRKRAVPRPTMGALEADPTAPSPPRRLPKKPSRPSNSADRTK